jgi:predicted adenine nucleotide alpha hydrolase (AANH) superfamily ATPase
MIVTGIKILLHICCAPCAIYPVAEMRAAGMDVTGFFFNNNIHPYQEFRRRQDSVVAYSEKVSLPVIYCDDYRMEDFLAAVAAKPNERCRYCYSSRLDKAAEVAAAGGFGCFTSSLLYSRYQHHESIRQLGVQAGSKYGVLFHYDDFRRGWQEGIRLSKSLGLYRQQYCGCIYSEKERYAPKNQVAVE